MNRNTEEVGSFTGLELAEMTTKFGGVIFRKAELEGSFEKVYSRVVKKMVELEFFGSNKSMLEILGETGG